MGGCCSGKAAQAQAFDHMPVRRENTEDTNIIEALRDFIKAMRLQHLKLENMVEALNDIKALFDEHKESNPTVDALKNAEELLRNHIQNNLNDVQSLINDISDLIAKTEQQTQKITEQSGEEELEKFQEKISDNEQQMPLLEKEIAELRRKWNQFLVETEDTESLIQDLTLLFNRVEQESLNYAKFIEAIKELLESLKMLFDCLLLNDVVKRDYEHKQESLSKHQEITKQSLIEYETINKRYQDAINQLSLIRNQFQSLVKGDQKAKAQDIQKVNDETLKFLDDNKSLGSDLVGLNKILTERREKLQDLDIIENLSERRTQVNALFDDMESLNRAVIALQQSLDVKIISAVDDETIQTFEPLLEEAKQMQTQIGGHLNDLDQVDDELKLIETDVQKDINSIKLENVRLLIPRIVKLAELGVRISKLKQSKAEIQQKTELTRLKLGEMNLGGKLKQQIELARVLREQLKAAEEELNFMLKLVHDMDGYQSDEEEQQTFKQILSQLEGLKLKHQMIENQCKKTSQQIESVRDSLKNRQNSQDEMLKLVQQLEEVEKLESNNEKDVEELMSKVTKQSQRFKEFDLPKKLNKRQKELQEGKGLQEKAKTRLTKLQRKILEKSDMRLSSENHKFLEELKLNSSQRSKQIDVLSAEHHNLEVELHDEFAPKIPKDTLSISIQEQIKLLKELKTLKDRIKQNNKGLYQQREQLKQMQQQLIALQEEQEEEVVASYQPVQGDEMDMLLSEFIRKSRQNQLNIVRLGNGQYMFGTKKISAKVMNGKLFVRVGGGFLSIEEYIQTYGEKELKKQKQKELEEMNSTSGFQQSSPPKKGMMKAVKESVREKIHVALDNKDSHGVIDLSLDDKVGFLNPNQGVRESTRASRSKNRQTTKESNNGSSAHGEEKKNNHHVEEHKISL